MKIMAKKLTTEEFIRKAKEVHGDKYDYSKVEYINAKTPIIIICLHHGEFTKSPDKFLLGQGCPQCSRKYGKKKIVDTESFIRESNKKFNNYFNYSKVRYVNSGTPVTITCPIHGDFEQKPVLHINSKCGCPKCSGKIQLTNTEFINKAKLVHGNKYNYSKSLYINGITEVCIICPEHGEFWQTPVHHISAKCGCPKCSESKGEREVEKILNEENIQYIKQYIINVPTNIRVTGIIKVDFYLPKHQAIIEYNGKQHYILQKGFGGQIKFDRQIIRDNWLRNYCSEHKIKLIEIPYTEKDIKTKMLNEL